MNESTTHPTDTASSWNAYWKGTGNVGAYSAGGANNPAVQGFWIGFLNAVKADYPKAKILDIASGNGAVVERIIDLFGENAGSITSVDISEAAIDNIRGRFQQVESRVADARALPFGDGSFDIVTSQFGVEYAGSAAFSEAARVVSPGGQLALLMHNASGVIHQECRTNLEGISRFIESEFLPAARTMFEAGFEAVRGADREPYDQAALELAPAVQEAEAIMNELGQSVADDTVARLYSDVGRIHGELQHYDPDEVLSWLDTMNSELESYRVRMASMVEAALDENEFEAVCRQVVAGGCIVNQAGPLLPPDDDTPLAWVLLAAKPA